jgi:hypothetical protein
VWRWTLERWQVRQARSNVRLNQALGEELSRRLDSGVNEVMYRIEYLKAERRRDVRACCARRGVAVQLERGNGNKDLVEL